MNKVYKVFVALALIISPAVALGQQSNPVTEQIIAGESVTIPSKVLGEDRRLLINLPEGYDEDPQRRYPVLYTLDGDTHFMHISGTVDWLSNQAIQIPRMIVVAITNTQRGRDMTASYNNGGADSFLKFIKTELVPFIDKQYRTQPFRILAGHSMAGHFALNAFYQSDNLFNAYIAMSPFFRQDRGETQLVNLLQDKFTKQINGNPFIYASIGDEERLMPMYEEFVKGLNNTSENVRWESFISDNDTHMSIPSNTINNALRFVFEPIRLSAESDVVKQGVKAIVEYYGDISKNIYGYTITPEPTINRLGYHHLFANEDTEKAIEVFKANVKLFPQSPNAYDSLAEGYQRNKQFKLAIEAMDKALALTSDENTGDKAYYKRHKTRIEKAMSEQGE